MPDPAELERQHLERTLKVAEQSGDKEWADAVRDELKERQPRKAAKKAAPAKKAAEPSESKSDKKDEES